MRRYERASTLITSNRPVEDWGKILGDTAAVGSNARPITASRSHPQVWSEKLAYEDRAI
jgi:DNA replication protein DnaC